jgi:uncharacterized protein YjbI with pentapeptide repeats
MVVCVIQGLDDFMVLYCTFADADSEWFTYRTRAVGHLHQSLEWPLLIIMRGAFKSANLEGASFKGADMARGMMEFASLRGADLTNAKLAKERAGSLRSRRSGCDGCELRRCRSKRR